MKYFINLIWTALAVYFCLISINNATADKVIVSPGVGYRFETNRNLLVENDDLVTSAASCTKFSLRNKNASKIIDSTEERKTPLGVRNCSPYYKIENKELQIGLWEFTGGISEYEIVSANTAKLTLIESETSKKFSRIAFYILFTGLWGWMVVFTNLYFIKKD